MGNLYGIAGAEDRSSVLSRALAAAGLSLLFVVVYAATNALAATRSNIGVLSFSWERHIPLVPLLIIPYMSIDLFFVGAPFLCRGRAELQLLVHRVIAAILIAGVFFLIYPLNLAEPRPIVEGWFGPIFLFLYGFDQPHNLFPSLHIILWTILAEKYAEKASSNLLPVIQFWFFLIAISTLLTHQHYVADVASGFMVAGAIFCFLPGTSHRTEFIPNRRIGFFYLAGTALFSFLVALMWPAGLMLAWPALSLGIVATAYFWLGPSITGKRNGQIPFTAWLGLWPWLLGQRISWIYYRSQCRAWDELVPGVRIGRILTEQEARQAVAEGVTAVLDLTCEFDEATAFRKVRYLNLPVLDLTAPTDEVIETAVEFIAEESRRGIVYIHCKIGYSRTACIAAAYLLRNGLALTRDAAVERIRSVRPAVVIRPEIWRALERFEAVARPLRARDDQPGARGISS